MKPDLKLLCILLTVLLCSCGSSHTFLLGADALHDLGNGRSLSPRKAAKADGLYGTLQRDLFGSPQSIAFVRVSPARYAVNVLSAEQQAADSTSALCMRSGAVAGINGSYFDMGNLTNVTYIKDDGTVSETTVPSDISQVNGAVFLKDGIIRIDAADTRQAGEGDWREVMASGPILIDEGSIKTYTKDTPNWEGFYNHRHPRSLIGQDAKGYVWLVVVDGRSDQHAAGMSIAELTELSRKMGLTDALNLDGGGSSTLWTLPGGVISHPSDNGRFDHQGQRIVPNILTVIPVR